MAQSRAANWPFAGAAPAIAKTVFRLTSNIRLTVLLAVVLICGSFASAAVLQIRLERARAEDQAAQVEAERARTLAADLGATLDRYAALSIAFADAPMSHDTAAALSFAGGRGLRNIAVFDLTGAEMSMLRDRPLATADTIHAAALAARHERLVLRAPDQSAVTFVFPWAGSLIAMEFDPRALFPRQAEDVALIGTNGAVIAGLGAGVRPAAAAPVPGWPVRVSAGLSAGDARAAWYRALPLYLFVVIGPALVGAWLAFVFVREFERRARAHQAVKALKTARPAETRLLVRLADAERRAAEAERSKSEFLAHMSHELRTPLNAIIGFSEVIERGLFGPAGHGKYVEYAHDIGAAGRGLHSKIGDILEFASIEAGRYPLVLGQTDVVPVARACIEEIAGQTFARRVKLAVSLPTSAPARADAAALKRVLINLLSNAARYTPEDGTIRVEAQNEAGSVCLRIRDSGLGFQPGERPAMGRPFMRFDRSGAKPGLGLGLSVAMALARQMGGALVIRSTPGEGTVAELRLTRA